MDAIVRVLEDARRIVLTTHVTPDGDGLGSALALMRFLRGRGADARLINCSSTPDNLRFLVRPGEFSVFADKRHGSFVRDAEAIIATDIGGAVRLGKMEPVVREASGCRIVIDHHIYENDLFDEALIVTGASSSSEIACDLIRHMGGTLNRELSEPLYVGLVSDTGNFCYTSTSSRVHRLAAELVDAGADPTRIWRKLACEVSWTKMRALGRSLVSLQEAFDGRVAWTSVDLAFLKQNSVPARDAFEVVNYFLLLEHVEVGVFFMEISGTRTKVSLRSAGRVDVCGIAARHGGGGHRYAAGCTVDGHDLAGARKLILGEVAALLPDSGEDAS